MAAKQSQLRCDTQAHRCLCLRFDCGLTTAPALPIGVKIRTFRGGNVGENAGETAFASLEHIAFRDRLWQHAWIYLQAVFRAGGFEEPRCDAVPQSARTEVNADPDPVFFIGEQINVMVAATHGFPTELPLSV